jgi:hypothetical protein
MNEIRQILLLFAMTLSFGATAQSFEWAAAYGGQNSDEAIDIQRDTLGNLYVIGTFKDTLQIDTIILVSNGSDDVFFAKFDSLGNVIWAKKVGGLDSDKGIAIDIDTSGNTYLVGLFKSPITLGNTTLNPSGVIYNYFLSKIDNLGNVLWATKIYTPGIDYATLPFNAVDLAVSKNGIVYLTGVFQGNVQFPTTTLNAVGNNFIPTSYLVKFNTNGVYQNGINISAANRTYASSITVDNQGNPIVGGYAYSTSCLGCAVNGIQDLLVFVRRYNSTSLGLTKSVTSSTAVAPDGFSNLGVEVAVDENNDIYLAGEFLGNFTFSGILLSNSNSISTTDIFIAKV